MTVLQGKDNHKPVTMPGVHCNNTPLWSRKRKICKFQQSLKEQLKAANYARSHMGECGLFCKCSFASDRSIVSADTLCSTARTFPKLPPPVSYAASMSCLPPNMSSKAFLAASCMLSSLVSKACDAEAQGKVCLKHVLSLMYLFFLGPEGIEAPSLLAFRGHHACLSYTR